MTGKEKIPMRIAKGCLTPADRQAVEALRRHKYGLNDLVYAQLSKPRNPKFHRLAHQFAALMAQSVDQFSGMAAHDVLKRLQIEGDVACDEIPLNFPGLGPCSYRVPRSLSFESMDEAEFQHTMGQIADYVVDTYWHNGMTSKELLNMAQDMPQVAA